MSKKEEPVTTAKSDDDSVTTHPAFCQIRAGRVSGYTSLYDSDFKHQAYMTVRICHSELHRHLSRDWHFGNDEIIEVAMSEAQWATFVSSANLGDGVPCTLQRLNGKAIPGLPDPKSRTAQFSDEVKKALESSLNEIDLAIAEIESLGLSKAKAERIRSRLENSRRDIECNIPFIDSQFEEHMEKTVEKAKSEIHGWMLKTIQHAGLEALGSPGPLEITDGKSNTDDAKE